MTRINRMIIVLIILIALAFVSENINSSDTDILILNPQPWDHSPITVYIDENNVPEHYSPSYRTDVENALEYWENGGNGQLEYQPVFEIVDVDNADILIMWVENLEEDAGIENGVAGFTRPYEVNGQFERADVVLETGNYQGYSWVQYGDASMQDIATHELGHALGLGHSNDKNDIMFPTYDPGEDINPLLLHSTWPLLLLLVIAAIVVISYHSTGWLHYKKKRKELEEEIFSEKKNDR
ncbi:matrixin family metalloprotease [Methanolobus mangrovi]|uniref:Matrixin family metalloprotease n=1 Tax=Methanolobus mangrovi TaxID=3072977 RepID=A0AA51UED0_9EURY|nr:matrixin family metalloprotease [Methanolobus mangrovi]WMW21606.1 matrixin family metalloprotease [Methanolobus mangrovi]